MNEIINNKNITGKRIKNLRVSHSLTQDELGKKINLKKSIISRFEGGSVLPSREALNSLSTYFDVSIDYLLGKINTYHHNTEIENRHLCILKKLEQLPKKEQEKILNILEILIK